MVLWDKVSPLLSKITNKWITLITDLQQALPTERLPEIEAVVRNIESNLAQQFTEFDSLADRLLNQSRVPLIISPMTKLSDRSVGEEEMGSQLDELKEHLRTAHDENVKTIVERLTSLTELDIFNV